MGLEITSLILTLLLLIFSVISLIQHGYYSYGDNTYNAESNSFLSLFHHYFMFRPNRERTNFN